MSLSGTLISAWALADLTDSYGSNTMTNNINTVTFSAGKLGNGALFDVNLDQMLSRPTNSSLDTGNIDFTIMAWVYITSKASAHTIHNIAAKDSSTDGEYGLLYNNDVDRFRFSIFGSAGGGDFAEVEASNFGAPSVSTWYFLIAWHDANANTINIQVNNTTPNSIGHTLGAYVATGGTFGIGGSGSSGDRFLTGMIDEMAFFKGAPTAGEISFLYNGGTGRTVAEIISQFGVPAAPTESHRMGYRVF